MEYLPMIISIIGCVISVGAFVASRKDKAKEDTAQEVKQYSKHDLIEYRLDELSKKVDKILDKLDTTEKEMDEKIKVAFSHHINEYHKQEKER